MRARPLVVFLTLGWSVFAVPAHLPAEVTLAPRTELLTLHSRIFGNTRTIRVWLPPGYDDSAQANSRYPVFYFTDGIATFHGRHLDTIAEELIRKGKIPPTIFVGIDNGGSTSESKSPGSDRANEYLPYPDSFLDPPLPSPQGNLFPDFLEKEVRPLVESRFRTQDAVGLAGASYGAVIVLFTIMERPRKYRWLLLESPSLYIDDDHLLRRAAQFHDWPERIYIAAGTEEGEGDDKREMVDDVHQLEKSVGSDSRVCTVVVPGAEHSEDAWRERLPTALSVLLGSASCPEKNAKQTVQ